MSLQTTRWSPDTCPCILEYTWDDTISVISRTHIFKDVIKACSFHIGLIGESHYLEVLSENQRKNLVLKLINSVVSDVDLSEYIWTFDLSRILEVSFTRSLTDQNKIDLQALCDTQFGVNKIKVL